MVDDASGDGSAAIAAAQGCRVVRLPENRGVSAARNAGVAATTGDVVFFLDSDVALRPDAVENALRVLDDDPERGCVQGVYEPEPLIDDGPAEWYRILHAAYWRRRTSATSPVSCSRSPPSAATCCAPWARSTRRCATARTSSTAAARGHLPRRPHRRRPRAPRRREPAPADPRRAVAPGRPARPLALAASRRGGGQPEHANRPAGILACALAMATLPAGLLHPALLALPLALLACFAAADPGLLRFVHRRRGAAFTAYFMTVHLAVHMVLVSGLAAGSLRLLPGLRRAQSTAALR